MVKLNITCYSKKADRYFYVALLFLVIIFCRKFLWHQDLTKICGENIPAIFRFMCMCNFSSNSFNNFKIHNLFD